MAFLAESGAHDAHTQMRTSRLAGGAQTFWVHSPQNKRDLRPVFQLVETDTPREGLELVPELMTGFEPATS